MLPIRTVLSGCLLTAAHCEVSCRSLCFTSPVSRDYLHTFQNKNVPGLWLASVLIDCCLLKNSFWSWWCSEASYPAKTEAALAWASTASCRQLSASVLFSLPYMAKNKQSSPLDPPACDPPTKTQSHCFQGEFLSSECRTHERQLRSLSLLGRAEFGVGKNRNH